MIQYEKYNDSVLRAVLNSDRPVDVENVRKTAGIKVWETAKAILLDLMAQGQIHGVKTTKSWIFWAENKQQPSQSLNLIAKQQQTR